MCVLPNTLSIYFIDQESCGPAAQAHQSQSQHLNFDSYIISCFSGGEEVRHPRQNAYHHGQWHVSPGWCFFSFRLGHSDTKIWTWYKTSMLVTAGATLHNYLKNFLKIIYTQLTYRVVLISALQQTYSVIHIYTYSLLYRLLFHYGLSQDVEYNSLCYTVGPLLLFFFFLSCKILKNRRKKSRPL